MECKSSCYCICVCMDYLSAFFVIRHLCDYKCTVPVRFKFMRSQVIHWFNGQTVTSVFQRGEVLFNVYVVVKSLVTELSEVFVITLNGVLFLLRKHVCFSWTCWCKTNVDFSLLVSSLAFDGDKTCDCEEYDVPTKVCSQH